MITKVMGVLLFFTGLGGILLGTAGMFGAFPQLGLGEQLFLTMGGAILCVLGYVMARDRPPSDQAEDEKSEPS